MPQTILQRDVEKIPSPERLAKEIRRAGYCGQDAAVRSLCLVAYRHLRNTCRLRSRQIKDADSLPPFDRVLMAGPTGCGKTFLVEVLFGRILKIPHAIVDVTGFTETGYIGESISGVLTRLIHAANSDMEAAQHGVLFLDEFDKLASAQSNAVFDGAGTTKDVAGHGVQKELLKILGGQRMLAPLRGDSCFDRDTAPFNTATLTIFAAGAFSGFDFVRAYRQPGIVGFGAQAKNRVNAEGMIQTRFSRADVDDVENLTHYGLMPELLGRFNRVVVFDPLDRQTLKDILDHNVLTRFRTEFRQENLALEIEESVLDLVVERAMESKTGARGLHRVLAAKLEEAAFNAFGNRRFERAILRLHDGDILCELN